MQRSTLLSLALFLFSIFPSMTMAQLSGTNGLLSCGTNNKGRKTVYISKQANEFVTPTLKSINHKAAINIMSSKIRKEQRNVVRKARRLRSRLQGNPLEGQVFNALEKPDQRLFNKLMPQAKTTEHLTGPALTTNATVGDALTALEEIINNSDTVDQNWKAALRVLKKCKGCESDAQRVRSFVSRRRKKRKCDCFTKTVDASFEFFNFTNPQSQNNCRSFSLARWSAQETKNATSVTVFYVVNNDPSDVRSKSGEPPYDDVYEYYTDQFITVSEGMHQLQVNQNSRSAGNPDKVVDCSDLMQNLQEFATGPYYVEANICPLGKQ